MTDRSEGHLDEARLAAIADGDRATPEEELHLARCRTCAAVHAELVGLRVASLVGATEDPPPEILAAGHRFVEERIPARRTPHRKPGISPWRRGALRIAPALVAVAAIVVMVGRGSSPDVELSDATRIALIEMSTEEGQVHPLVWEESTVEHVGDRGDGPAAHDQLEAHRDRNLDSVEAVAAYVASLQTDPSQHKLAREVLDEALQKLGDDATLRRLELYQLSLEGRVDELEHRLEARVESHPDDRLARLNLAILHAQRGKPASMEEAWRLARDLAGDGDSVMEVRARRVVGE